MRKSKIHVRCDMNVSIVGYANSGITKLQVFRLILQGYEPFSFFFRTNFWMQFGMDFPMDVGLCILMVLCWM